MLILLLKKKIEKLLHLQKLLTFFQQNTCELDIVFTYELVKLTMLWTTGPSSTMRYSPIIHSIEKKSIS